MSKRLASFGGPSAPSSSPITVQSNDTTPTKTKPGPKNKNKGRDATPASPNPSSREPKSPFSKAGVSSPSFGSRTSAHAPRLSKNLSATLSESSLQIYTRTALKRTASDLEEWDTLASRRAPVCVKILVDKTTELDNALSILPEGIQPRSRALGPRLRELNSKREEFRGYLVDLDVSFTRIAERLTVLEAVLAKLTERDWQESTEDKPIWDDTSWSFSCYVSHIAKILRQLNRTRCGLASLAEQIIDYSLSSSDHNNLKAETKSSPPTFTQARTALASWSSEASRIAESIKEWLEMCEIEVPVWDEIQVEQESDDEFDVKTL